jgi:hypothetical protein
MTNNEKRLAQYILQLMEGDTHMMEDMYAFLQELGATDEDGFGTEELYSE